MAPGPKPRLTRDQIVAEAARLLATDGAEQLSMRKLGSRLGLTARALYGYFESKEELEAALVGYVMPAPPPLDPDTPWTDQLRAYVLRMRDAFVEQPGAARLFAVRSASGPAMDRAREYLLSLLVSGGLGEREAVAALGTISRYLMGCVVVEGERRARPTAPGADRFANLSTEEFPTLSRLASRYADRDSDESTRFGLDLILSALQLHVRPSN